MFTLKERQIDALREPEERDFEARCARQLRAHFPEELAALDERGLLSLVHAGRARAARYGISTLREVALFLGAMAELGADFDTRPEHGWAAEILRDPRFDAECKMDLVYGRLLARPRAQGDQGSRKHV
jgi:hypothetical protein